MRRSNCENATLLFNTVNDIFREPMMCVYNINMIFPDIVFQEIRERIQIKNVSQTFSERNERQLYIEPGNPFQRITSICYEVKFDIAVDGEVFENQRKVPAYAAGVVKVGGYMKNSYGLCQIRKYL